MAKASQWEFENYPEDYPEGLNIKANGCNEEIYTLNNETIRLNLTKRDDSIDKNYFTATFNGKQCKTEIYLDSKLTASLCRDSYNAYLEYGNGDGFEMWEWRNYSEKKTFEKCLVDIGVPAELQKAFFN